MKKIILISVLIGAMGAIGYFSYPIIHDRYFSPPSKIENSNHPIEFHDINKEIPVAAEAPANDVPTVPGEENSAPAIDGKKNVQTNITRKDCDEECQAFSKDPNNFSYCQEVCGLAPAENISECDSKAGLSKDYCQKDLAVSKTDSALCESIKDDNIRKTCKNRVYEDIQEKMRAGTDDALK